MDADASKVITGCIKPNDGDRFEVLSSRGRPRRVKAPKDLRPNALERSCGTTDQLTEIIVCAAR